MVNLILIMLQKFFGILSRQWDTLVKKVGKSTANTLLTYLALGILFEVIWLILMISLVTLVYILD